MQDSFALYQKCDISQGLEGRRFHMPDIVWWMTLLFGAHYQIQVSLMKWQLAVPFLLSSTIDILFSWQQQQKIKFRTSMLTFIALSDELG